MLQQGEGKWLAMFSDCREKEQPIQQCSGCQKTAEDRGEAEEDMAKRWVSAGMEPAGSPITVIDGGFSSPDAPRGTGGHKVSL